jgi:hypothetical protein
VLRLTLLDEIRRLQSIGKFYHKNLFKEDNWSKMWIRLDCYRQYYKDTTLNDVIREEIKNLGGFLVEYEDKTFVLFKKSLREKVDDTFLEV